MESKTLINKLNETFLREKRWVRIEGFSYSENKKKIYNPHYFLRLVTEKGYYGAIKFLVERREKTAGLETLWDMNALDESVEYFVTQTELGKEYEIYNKLFTDEERLYCVQLLEEEYNFDFKKKSRKDLLMK